MYIDPKQISASAPFFQSNFVNIWHLRNHGCGNLASHKLKTNKVLWEI